MVVRMLCLLARLGLATGGALARIGSFNTVNQASMQGRQSPMARTPTLTRATFATVRRALGAGLQLLVVTHLPPTSGGSP